jgi:hypothetical protein
MSYPMMCQQIKIISKGNAYEHTAPYPECLLGFARLFENARVFELQIK